MKKTFQIGLISPYSHVSAMGLRQISACLKAAGWDSRMIFLPDMEESLHAPWSHQQSYPPSILDQVGDLCTDLDLVGISVMSNFVGRARALTETIHQRSSTPVIWGGIHPTVRPDECLAWADFACVGEGEGATVELVGRLAAGQDCTNVPNIWLKDAAGHVIANPVRPLDRSLDDLPLPDYELSQQYVLHQGQIVPLTPVLLAQYMLEHFANEIRISYLTSVTRGCPYDCTYCCANALVEIYPDWRRLRRRSPEHVIAEIKAASRLIPGLQVVKFLDDSFLATSTAEIRRFSQLYREQVELPFFVLGTPGSVSEEKLHYLVEAGLRDVEMGIQTGSQRTRTLYHRPESNDQVLSSARCIHKFRRWIPYPRYDIISDNPYETQADHLETLRLLYQLPRPCRFYLFSLTPYPGTELYRRAKADGLIRDDERDVYCKNLLRLEPTFYNLVLWGVHRNLPRWLLRLLAQAPIFRLFSSTAMGWLVRLAWKAVERARRHQVRRQALHQTSRLTSMDKRGR